MYIHKTCLAKHKRASIRLCCLMTFQNVSFSRTNEYLFNGVKTVAEVPKYLTFLSLNLETVAD